MELGAEVELVVACEEPCNNERMGVRQFDFGFSSHLHVRCSPPRGPSVRVGGPTKSRESYTRALCYVPLLHVPTLAPRMMSATLWLRSCIFFPPSWAARWLATKQNDVPCTSNLTT